MPSTTTPSAAASIRSKIFSSTDIESEELDVPQWGVTVEVRGMDGNQRAAFVQNYADHDGKLQYAELYPELIIAGTFDPGSGDPIFNEADRSAIMTKSGAALELVATTVMRLSGLGEDAADAVGKDGSSTTTTNDGSTSTSPNSSA